MADILSDRFVLKLARKIDPTNDTPEEFSTYLGFTKAEGSLAAIGGNIVQNQRKAYQTILTKYTMVHGRKKDSAVELIKMLLQNEMKDCADLVREELEKFGITVPSDGELTVDHPVSLTTPPCDIPDNMDTQRPKESRLSGEVISEGFSIPQDAPNPTDKRKQTKQNETQNQSAGSEDDHTNDEEDDLIQLEKHGITVRISKHEIYSAKDISVEVIEDVPPELELKETEAIISVGLKMSPSDAVFESPVRVTMPHCGAFIKPKDAEVYIYYRKNDSTEFTAIHSSSTSSPRCVVRDRDLDICINHFSLYWIVAKLKQSFIGKHVVCTPCVPVPAPRNEEHVLLVNVRDQHLAEWRVHDGYKVPTPGVQFFVKWHSGELKISCKAKNIINETEFQTIKESDFRNLTEHHKTFVVDTRSVTMNKVILEFTFQQSTTQNLHVEMRLGETVTVISDISEEGASSPLPIESPSTGIPPAETTGSDPSPETRVPMGRGENDFDDILREIAKQVNKRQDVDALGVKLGFHPSEIESYFDNNRNASHMGTLQMLRDWMKRTKKSKEHELLRQALVGIKYIRLADELLGVDKLT